MGNILYYEYLSFFMKLVKNDGTELELDPDRFKYFIEGTVNIITDGLIHKFLVATGVTAVSELIPLTKEYCKMAKFVGKDEFKESYDIITEILDSDAPYIEFKNNYKRIKIIDDTLLSEWKNVIDKQISQKTLKTLMFS